MATTGSRPSSATSYKNVFTKVGIDDTIQFTYCVVPIEKVKDNDKGCKTFGSGNGSHAEVKMIKSFKKKYDAQEIKGEVLDVYLSRAPCRDCAGELHQFCEEYNVKMHIKAVDGYYKGNKKGLKTLLDSGTTLAAFTEEDFSYLANLLKEESWGYDDDMETRDVKTKRYFESLKLEMEQEKQAKPKDK